MTQHLLLPLVTTELVPPQPRDQALHTHELCALFCVLLLHFFFSPFWKRKHTDYTDFQKGKQLLQIPEQSSLLKLKFWVFSHGKNEAGERKSCSLLVEKASLYSLNCKGSWYKAGLPVFPPCWQAVSSQDIPCKRSKVWKNKHEQQFGKMKRRKRSVTAFFLSQKTSQLPPPCALLLGHFWQVTSFEKGREEKSHLF